MRRNTEKENVISMLSEFTGDISGNPLYSHIL